MWMNESALVKFKKKQVIQKIFETREGHDFVVIARARNQATWVCRCAVRDFEKKIAEESKANPNTFCGYAKGKLKARPAVYQTWLNLMGLLPPMMLREWRSSRTSSAVCSHAKA